LKLANSVLAVIAGFLAIAILAAIVDTAMRGVSVFPYNPVAYQEWMLFVALVYRSLFAFVGGMVVARVASSNQMRRVVILGVIGLLIGIAGVVSGWNLVGYPHWYSISLTVLTFPAIWYGGRLAAGKQGNA
jgi:hypothetical protein